MNETTSRLQRILETPVERKSTDRRHKLIDADLVFTLERNLELPALSAEGIAPALLFSARQKRILVVFSATRSGAERALEAASGVTSPYVWLDIWAKRGPSHRWTASDLVAWKIAFRRDRPDAWQV